jgi:hypothetical protein
MIEANSSEDVPSAPEGWTSIRGLIPILLAEAH